MNLNLEHHDIVAHETTNAGAILEFARGIEGFDDPTLRRDYLEQLTEDDFIGLTQQVASVIRTGISSEYQPFDGQQVMLGTFEVPDHEDKDALIRETWDTAKGILKDRKLSDEEVLEYAALTVAGGIVFAHPFIDGNGRTSRVLSYMISRGGQKAEELEGIIGDSLSKEWQSSPSDKLTRSSLKFNGSQPEKLEWEMQFAGEAEDALDGKIASTLHDDKIVRAFIETADTETMSVLEPCITRDEQGEATSIDADKMLKVLANNESRGIEYATKIVDLQRQFRAESVRNFLNAMKSNERGTIRTLHRSEVSQTEGSNDESQMKVAIIAGYIGSRAVDGEVSARDEVVARHRGYSRIHQREYTNGQR